MTIILNVCLDCAKEAGSKPKPMDIKVWLGECCGCGRKTGCTAPNDWTPTVTSFNRAENLAKAKAKK